MRSVLLSLLVVVAGCRGALVFECFNSGQCSRAGKGEGKCLAATSAGKSYCAFPDTDCDSRLRFDSSAGQGLAGQCTGVTPSDGFVEPLDFTGTNADLVGTPPPPDMTGTPSSLKWAPVNINAADDLYCVTGYDRDHLFIGGVEGIFYSADAGKTWSRQTLPGGGDHIVGIWSSAAGTFAVGWNGQIFHVTGNSTNWERQVVPNGMTPSLYGIWGASASKLFIVGADGTALHTSDGKNWIAQNANVGGMALNSVWGFTELDAWAVGNNFQPGGRAPIIHTASGGSQWATEVSPTEWALFRVWGPSVKELYAVGEQNVLLKSNGSGWSLLKKATGIKDDYFGGLWGSSASDIYVSGSGGTLLHSADSGASWQELNSGSGFSLNYIWGTGPDNVWIAGGSGTVLHGTR